MDVECDCDALGQIELAAKKCDAELESLRKLSLASKILSPVFATPTFFSFAKPQVKEEQQQKEPVTVENEWKPKYLEYRKYSARVKSFANWPMQMNPRPEELAKAGFFYEGVSDSCSCFHCGLTVHNWENTDDPVEEHFRHGPRCNFVAYLM